MHIWGNYCKKKTMQRQSTLLFYMPPNPAKHYYYITFNQKASKPTCIWPTSLYEAPPTQMHTHIPLCSGWRTQPPGKTWAAAWAWRAIHILPWQPGAVEPLHTPHSPAVANTIRGSPDSHHCDTTGEHSAGVSARQVCLGLDTNTLNTHTRHL